MADMELAAAFNVALHVPPLSQAEQRSVLQQLGAFGGPDVSAGRAGCWVEGVLRCRRRGPRRC